MIVNAPPWKIEWSDELSMLNPEIDDQHKNFVKLINDLNAEIMDVQGDKAVIQHKMRLVLDDAIVHFRHEERLMAEKAYPDAEEHTLIHSKLIDEFNQAQEDIQGSDIRAVWVKMGMHIKDKLVSHLLNEDSRYIEYLRVK